ncbi:MAG: hypothetical protein U1E51_32440, partial [Candidatus Binatia bacterium]|nr:hypothetical protein [Candidatus Binatia bacterium]
YEELARRDPNFRKRYLLYVNTGYMKATMDQLTVSNYQIASRIPELVTSGQFEEAEKLNSSVLDRLTNEPQETQRLVEKHQGINARLLKSNAEYIGNLQKDRRM